MHFKSWGGGVKRPKNISPSLGTKLTVCIVSSSQYIRACHGIGFRLSFHVVISINSKMWNASSKVWKRIPLHAVTGDNVLFRIFQLCPCVTVSERLQTPKSTIRKVLGKILKLASCKILILQELKPDFSKTGRLRSKSADQQSRP